jgi:hypothetical protein
LFTFIISTGTLFPTRGRGRFLVGEVIARRGDMSPAGISPRFTTRLSSVGALLGRARGARSFRDGIPASALDALGSDGATGILLGILDVTDVVARHCVVRRS